MATELRDFQSKIGTIARINIAVALAVVVLKYIAYQVSGSVALFSDALESVVNVVTAIAALVAIRVSAKPADSDHPFGHHKAEFLAAMFVGAMIAVAAVLILIKAYGGLVYGVTLEHPSLGIAFNAGAAAGTPAGPGCSSAAARRGVRPHSSPTGTISLPTSSPR